MLQLLEAGQPLPPDPRQMGRPKESAQSFLRRMDKLQARYDAQFLKRKDWQVCTMYHRGMHHVHIWYSPAGVKHYRIHTLQELSLFVTKRQWRSHEVVDL